MNVIGVDLGGTKLAAAIFDLNGKIIYKNVLLLEGRKGEQVAELICSQIEILLTNANEDGINITNVGVSVPGISYPKTGKVWAPNIPGWDDLPLLEILHSRFGNKNIHFEIDSDRACYILGETWLGSAQGCRNAIFISVGTGIGAGILIEGNILRGSNGIAGAVGWLALNKPYFDKYKKYGCYEYNASGNGIVRVTKEHLVDDKTYEGELASKDLNSLTANDVFEAYDSGDIIATKVLAQAVEYWGMSVANLVSVFNPEKIIFGGGVFGPATRFLTEIMKEAEKWAQPISIKQVKLESSTLGGDAGLIGAGRLAMNNYNQHINTCTIKN
jgi:glucokinase